MSASLALFLRSPSSSQQPFIEHLLYAKHHAGHRPCKLTAFPSATWIAGSFQLRYSLWFQASLRLCDFLHFDAANWSQPDMTNEFILSVSGHLWRALALNQEGISPPRGHSVVPRNIFGYHNLGRGPHWHLVGRGQACCSTSYNAQGSLTKENRWAQHGNSAELEKPWCKGKKPLGNQKYNDFFNGRFLSILHNNVAPCEFPAVPTIFALR